MKKSQTKFENQARLPRPYGQFEMTKSTTISKETKKKIYDYKRALFTTNATHPYLADYIASKCRIDSWREKIVQANKLSDSLLYTTGKVLLRSFMDDALYDKAKKNQRESFLRELRGGTIAHDINDNDKSKLKYIPTGNGGYIQSPPFIVLFQKEGKPENKSFKNLYRGDKSLEQKGQIPNKYIEILFSKYLWQNVIEGEEFGRNWIPMPTKFWSKLKYFISINPKFLSELNFSESCYRQFFIYLNLHDNKKGIALNLNTLHFAKHVLGSQAIQINTYGKEYIRSWWNVKQFIDSAMTIFAEMGKAQLMGGARFIPSRAFYDKDTGKIKVYINRILLK